MGERGGGGGCFGDDGLTDLDLADHAAAVIVTAFKANQRRADVCDIMFGAKQTQYAAGIR